MVYYWDPGWIEFRRKHSIWLKRQQANAVPGDVLYRLPSLLVDALAQPLRVGRPILSEEDIAAEHQLDSLCNPFRAVAVSNDLPVTCSYLLPPAPSCSTDSLKAVGLNGKANEVRQALRRLQDCSDREKSYVGRLVTDPVFRRDRDGLRQQWQQLPLDQRSRLQLSRTVVLVPTDESATAFRAEFDDFCDRYGLLGMTTWDLPNPAGPLLDGLPKPPHLLAGRPVVLALPAHFSLLKRDDLHSMIENLQREHLRDARLDPSCVGPRAVELYGHLLVIEHFQRVVLGRYGAAPRPKGLVNRLKAVIAVHLDLSTDHFRTLYRTLTGLLRSQPHAAPCRR